nr:TraR/DksA C4-type zinc finger protein [Azospirillum argentinense]
MADDADHAAHQADLTEVGLMEAVAGIRDQLAGTGRAVCGDCGAPIPARRRDAYPAAVRCIGCQQHLERRDL